MNNDELNIAINNLLKHRLDCLANGVIFHPTLMEHLTELLNEQKKRLS